jgi:hypothetical protein
MQDDPGAGVPQGVLERPAVSVATNDETAAIEHNFERLSTPTSGAVARRCRKLRWRREWLSLGCAQNLITKRFRSARWQALDRIAVDCNDSVPFE